MSTSQYNRRNFLSSLAILSAGTAFGSAVKHLPFIKEGGQLQKDWNNFWKQSGGRIFQNLTGIANNKKETKGHKYEYGEVIYFPKENILARPTWIFWENDRSKPADVIITLFENNHSFKKIICLNRYEMNALYHLSKQPGSEQLLLASFNNSKPAGGPGEGVIITKINIKNNSQIQDISFYKGQVLVFKDQFIHHT